MVWTARDYSSAQDLLVLQYIFYLIVGPVEANASLRRRSNPARPSNERPRANEARQKQVEPEARRHGPTPPQGQPILGIAMMSRDDLDSIYHIFDCRLTGLMYRKDDF